MLALPLCCFLFLAFLACIGVDALPLCTPDDDLIGHWHRNSRNLNQTFEGDRPDESEALMHPVPPVPGKPVCPLGARKGHWCEAPNPPIKPKNTCEWYFKAEYKPSACEVLPFNALDFLEMIYTTSADRTLIVIGDSVSRDFWDQLTCSLHAYLAYPGHRARKRAIRDLSLNYTLNPDDWLQDHEADINKIVQIHLREVWPHDTSTYAQALREYPRAIYIANIGAHYLPYGTEATRLLAHEMATWAIQTRDHKIKIEKQYGSLLHGPHIFFRETSAQHFGTFYKYFQYNGIGRADCKDWGDTSLPKNEEYWQQQLSSRASVERILQADNIPLMRTHSYTRDAVDMHIGTGDCTHWWMPSGVYRLWMRLLRTFLEPSYKAIMTILNDHNAPHLHFSTPRESKMENTSMATWKPIQAEEKQLEKNFNFSKG